MKIYLLLVAIILLSCQGQKGAPDSPIKEDLTAITQFNQSIQKDTIMINREQVESERYNNTATEGGTKSVSIKKGEWIIDVYSMSGLPHQNEYAPARDFYKIQKTYNKNGIMESRGELLGFVPFGNWEFFDENGNLIREVDEEAKFGKIKPRDVVDIIEKLGIINRKTGESILLKEPTATDGSFYKALESLLTIHFVPAKYSETKKETSSCCWLVSYYTYNTEVSYAIEGNTGECTRNEWESMLSE